MVLDLGEERGFQQLSGMFYSRVDLTSEHVEGDTASLCCF